ncbi:MAG: hypothetical protein N4A33_12780 [Bacteriovoracaceae bacterium]|jgi:hypothetical protein|nr:hypothetical protein [Bacteriovoracaceae bacterium]
MSTKKILFILAIIVTFFIFLTLKNLVLDNKRTFSLINITDFDSCFLIPSDYKVEKLSQGFKYYLKNNYGHIVLEKRSFDESNLTKARVGEFEVKYAKLKNDRVFEYKLNNDFLLKDTFVIIKKMQPNLVPLKSKCKKLKKLYPILMELK